MHFLLLIFEHISKFLEDNKIKKIINLILIISVLYLFTEVSHLKSHLISYDEKINHHQKSITTGFEKMNNLEVFIREKQDLFLSKFIDILQKK